MNFIVSRGSKKDDELSEAEMIRRSYKPHVWHKNTLEFRNVQSELNIKDRTRLQNFMKCFIPERKERDRLVVNDIHEGSVSFGFDDMKTMNPSIISHLSNDIKNLDLSYNNLSDLSFLSEFHLLENLVLDSNVNLDYESIPELKKLKLLYVNKCQIYNIVKFVYHICKNCPNLRYLSMMGMKLKDGKGLYIDRHNFRMFVIYLIPSLVHLDDKVVAFYERQHASEKHRSIEVRDCFEEPLKSRLLPPGPVPDPQKIIRELQNPTYTYKVHTYTSDKFSNIVPIPSEPNPLSPDWNQTSKNTTVRRVPRVVITSPDEPPYFMSSSSSSKN
ncbi:unnamed protein product [Diamesa hyperborea]